MDKTSTPSVRLSPDMDRALREYADRANLPKTALMRLLLARGLDDIEAKGLGAVVAEGIDGEQEREGIEA